MMITLIVLIGYLLPMALMWRYLYLSHSPKGIRKYWRIDAGDMLTVFTPFANIITCLYHWTDSSPIDDDKSLAHRIITLGGYKEDKLKKH